MSELREAFERLEVALTATDGARGFAWQMSVPDVRLVLAALKKVEAERDQLGDLLATSEREWHKECQVVEAQRDALRRHLSEIVRNIDAQAAIQPDSMMAQVCGVLAKTIQVSAARALLVEQEPK